MADFASESGHWYLPSGEPYYSIVGKNGIERNVTLRDARKVGALPSVTGVLKCQDKPALTRWFVKQAVLASLTLPRNPDENDDAYIDRIITDSRQEGKDAADVGTIIHGQLERHARGDATDPHWTHWLIAADLELERTCGFQAWSAERSFACPLGYGGKVDLHSMSWVVDWKGKEGELTDLNCRLWDEHAQQGAAYRYGLGLPFGARVAIGFFSRDLPQVRLVEIPEPDLQKGWEMFSALLSYWRAKNAYKP